MKKRGSRLKNWFKRKFASQKPETRETERTASMAQVKEFKHTSSIAMNNGLVEMENVPTHIKQRAYEAMKVQKAMLKGGVRNSNTLVHAATVAPSRPPPPVRVRPPAPAPEASNYGEASGHSSSVHEPGHSP